MSAIEPPTERIWWKQPLDRVEHEPRKMVSGQPIAQARRQQQLLLAITRDEVLRHPGIVLNPPDDTPTYATATGDCASELT